MEYCPTKARRIGDLLQTQASTCPTPLTADPAFFYLLFAAHQIDQRGISAAPATDSIPCSHQ